MELLTLWMLVGFLFASMSIQTIQTLGTWIQQSTKILENNVPAVCCIIRYGWYINGGDTRYGRLNKILQEIQWVAMAPNYCWH